MSRRGFFWRERWRPNRPLRERDFDGVQVCDRPAVHVKPETHMRLYRYASEQGISIQRAVDRIFGMERNGPAEKRRAVENRRAM